MTEKTPAKKATAKKTAAKKTAHKPVKKAAKKAPAKKSTAKKATTRRPRGDVDIKVIQTVDEAPGRDTRVYFSDGSHAVVKRDTDLHKMLSRSETHAPAMMKVFIDHGQLTGAEPVEAP